MTTQCVGWVSFPGTRGEWIAERAKFGRRFVASERLGFDNGSCRVKFRCAHHLNDPAEVVAIQDNYMNTTTLYHPAFNYSNNDLAKRVFPFALAFVLRSYCRNIDSRDRGE